MTYAGHYKGIAIFKNGVEYAAESSWKGEQAHGTSLQVITDLIDNGGIYRDPMGNVHYRNEAERS